MDDGMMNFIDMNWDEIISVIKAEGIPTRSLDYDDIEDLIMNMESLYLWASENGVID